MNTVRCSRDGVGKTTQIIRAVGQQNKTITLTRPAVGARHFGPTHTGPHRLRTCVCGEGLIVVVSLGEARPFARVTWAYTVLETGSGAYLLYLAWKVATSSTMQVRDGERRPMRF